MWPLLALIHDWHMFCILPIKQLGITCRVLSHVPLRANLSSCIVKERSSRNTSTECIPDAIPTLWNWGTGNVLAVAQAECLPLLVWRTLRLSYVVGHCHRWTRSLDQLALKNGHETWRILVQYDCDVTVRASRMWSAVLSLYMLPALGIP